MRALYMRLSGLAGLLIFVREAWGYAPLERALFLGIGTGLAAYLVLSVGHMLVQQILAYTPPPESQRGVPDEKTDPGTGDSAVSDTPDEPEMSESDDLGATGSSTGDADGPQDASDRQSSAPADDESDELSQTAA